MHDMNVDFGLYYGAEQVMCPRKVVVDGVTLCARIFHAVRRSALFRKVHDGIRLLSFDQLGIGKR